MLSGGIFGHHEWSGNATRGWGCCLIFDAVQDSPVVTTEHSRVQNVTRAETGETCSRGMSHFHFFIVFSSASFKCLFLTINTDYFYC